VHGLGRDLVGDVPEGAQGGVVRGVVRQDLGDGAPLAAAEPPVVEGAAQDGLEFVDVGAQKITSPVPAPSVIV
jgi:hypothetical protein